MKSTSKTKNQSEKPQLNFRAMFTGEVLATPVKFNPTADDLRKIKNIKDDFDVKEPEYRKTIQGNEYQTVSLLLKFNPNKVLKLKNQAYPNEMFTEYKIYVSNRPNVAGKSGKTQIIDQHNQSAWIKLEGKDSLEKQVMKAQEVDSPYSPGDPLRKINPKTARVAMQGEVALYDLVFKMSTLDKHKINEDDATKSTFLEDFVLGENPKEVMENIFNGECTSLNMLVDKESDFPGKEFFFNKDGENNPIGVMLGVRPNDSGDKIYQEVYAPFTVFPVAQETTFRPMDKEYDYSDIKFNGVKLDKGHLNKKAVEAMTDANYPWKAFWNNSFKFQEVTVDDLPKQGNDIQPPVSQPTDDLPF
jgi:hypothetical protein